MHRRGNPRGDPAPRSEQGCRAEDPLREREARGEIEGLIGPRGGDKHRGGAVGFIGSLV